MYISPKMYYFEEVHLPNWPCGFEYILYNHFSVISSHSVLCFSNDYHNMVKEEKWNLNDLRKYQFQPFHPFSFKGVC